MRGTPTDKEIVRRIRNGDVECFSELVGDYSPRMMNLALGMVRGREAAEDVVQDALVKAFEKLGSWRGDSSLSTWLFRIVYTTAVSSLRAHKDIFVSSDEVADPVVADDNEWTVSEENIVRMGRALGTLSPLDRTLVNLFYTEDKSVREIGAICGESEANVKTRLHRVRVKLKKLMDDGTK